MGAGADVVSAPGPASVQCNNAMQTVLNDLRYALRQLLRNPGFALTAVLSLALGIGATTAVFSVIYGALIHPFPFRDADGIVRLTVQGPDGGVGWINPNGPQIRMLRQSPAVADAIVMDGWSLAMTGGEFAQNVEAIYLSSNGFDFLGDPVLLGRGLEPSDSVDGQEPQPVVVLGYRFWQRVFHGQPDAVGKSIELNRKEFRIVGVAEPRFVWYSGDVYLPLKLSQDPHVRYMVDLRLKPGLTRQAGNAALQPLLEQFARDTPQQYPPKFRVAVEGLNDWVVRQMGRTLYLLLGGVGLLLAIGCGNVSILLLARGTVREHELAVRSALGAARGRLVRQLLTEALTLALAGAALGVAVAYGAVAAMKAILPVRSFAPEVVFRINVPVLLFSASVALATGILFGLWPALRLSRPATRDTLQSGTRRVAGSARGQRIHGLLIGGQIALTLLLLAGAGAALSEFTRLLHAPLGYDPHNAVPVWVPLHENTYTTWSAREAYLEQVAEKLREVPGVTMATPAPDAIPPDSGWLTPVEVMGQATLGQPSLLLEEVGPEYFRTLGISLRTGRVWTAAENHDGARVAVINETMAKRFFPGGDAVGHSLRLPQMIDRPPIILTVPNLDKEPLEIIGVAADSRNNGLRKPVAPAVYAPWTLVLSPYTVVLVRSETPPLHLERAIRLALASLNPDQQTDFPFSNLEDLIANQPEWQQEQLVAWLFGAFAVLALCLAAVGLYSVVSYTVAQRTNEFGVRIALGASRGHVLRLVFGSTAISVGGGVFAGLSLTLGFHAALARWMGVDLRDPRMLAAGAAALALVAAVACAVPALRAARVEPMTALRYE